MLVGGWKYKEGLLLSSDYELVFVGVAGELEIVDFAFSKDENLGLDGTLLKGYPAGHVLDVLNDEVDRYSVVSEAGDGDVCVNGRRQYKVTVSIFHELTVLLQNTHNCTPTLSSVSL